MGIGEMLESGERTAASQEWTGSTRSLEPRAGGAPLTAPTKCPYLAGRPPCGTHHLFPSNVNVCWASAGERKPYGVISLDIQERHCFGGADGLTGCSRYQQATAAAMPSPQFERPRPGAPSGPEWALPPRRQPQRSALAGAMQLRGFLAWGALCLLLIALSALLLR